MTAVDWVRYRKCPVCFAELGVPCMTRSGSVGLGQVDRDRPHSRRQLRTGYGRGGGRDA